ncbi:hypothetical protein B0H13DRAFT_1876942 [Mycena leptocephala]|nr:hypothetical protein B0H13DRAFT_1876942 [Mycena leptocephala]
MNARAKICKVLWMLRRPLISDGAEEKALLRGVEDGSPTCAVAKPLRRDGVSGRNAVRCDAQKLLYQARLRRARSTHPVPAFCASRRVFPEPYAARKEVSYTHHGDESSGLDVGARCRDPADPLRRRDGRGQVVVVVEGKGRTCHKIIGSNEVSLNAIKVTRFRENKRSNEVTKKATTLSE